jgi:hypothetical protein
MRILLATEGESDEIVAQRLLIRSFPAATIEPKRFPARGFPVVLRLLPQIVRGAYFGHYDLLVVHFDLDSSLSPPFREVNQSGRWQEIRSNIDMVLSQLKPIGRESPLHSCLMTPCQSTDAWLAWAEENGVGESWEEQSRHELKHKLFGNPPRQIRKKAEALAGKLIAQMSSNASWPKSLVNFVEGLESSLKK